jgi:hypothetical protein
MKTIVFFIILVVVILFALLGYAVFRFVTPDDVVTLKPVPEFNVFKDRTLDSKVKGVMKEMDEDDVNPFCLGMCGLKNVSVTPILDDFVKGTVDIGDSDCAGVTYNADDRTCTFHAKPSDGDVILPQSPSQAYPGKETLYILRN